jgi:tetratricopeptide (TPR) repeat protein
MELHLARLDTRQTQVNVTCDGSLSHSFDMGMLIPTGTSSLPHPLADSITYGRALYAALFPPDSPAYQALAAKPSRILLVTADDVLDALPWEYTYGPNGYVVCSCSFVRGLPTEQRIAPPTMLSALHIVAVASGPLSHNLAPLNIQGEWTRLTEIVDDLQRAVTLERVWPPTVTRLRELVAEQQQRVVHFMGHGGQNAEGEAILCFERDDGTREDISAREFVQRVRGSVFLVTLNACQSATPGETAFGNLAKALVREHVPYALGTRFPVHDDDALAFSRDFYSSLTRGIPVEDALLQARLTLAKSKRAWAAGNFILYTSLSHAADGYATEPGEPCVHDAQENALRGIIGVLPEVQGTFQGRIDEQIQLGQWLTGDRRPRIMTIHGNGGQGKTVLARVAAERFAHAWPGGVWSMTLETIPTRAIFVASLARFLGINLQDSTERTDLERQLLLRLRRRRTLLVLDNMETLLEAAKAQDTEALALIEFIRQLPGDRTSLLCTSRHLLGWSEEQHLELSGLAPNEGAALFQQSAPQRVAEIELSLACQLSRRVDGHPLGLSLLGAAFNNSPIALPAFLADHEKYLLSAENIYIDVDHRQRKMFANFAYSVRWLSPELRDTLSKLWVFHAPFLQDVAKAVLDQEVDAEAPETSPIEDHLYALWQRGLVAREALPIGDNNLYLYRLPPVMRPYVEKYLADECEREELLKRFGEAYAKQAENIHSELVSGRAIATLAAQCYDDLARGVSFVEGTTQGYYLLYWGLILHWLGDWRRGMSMTEQALEVAEGHDRTLEGLALHNLAMISSVTGHPYEALRLCEQALVIQREVGKRAGEGVTISNVGSVYDDLGKRQEALEYYKQALVIRRDVGDRAGEGVTINNIGKVYGALGKKQEALDYYEQALVILREVGDRAGEGVTINNIGNVYDSLGKKQEALEYYKQALVIRREVGDRAGEGTTISNVGSVYSTLGKKQEALEYYKQALVIRREVGDRAGEGTTISNVGSVYDDLGKKQEALDYCEQALEIAQEVGNRAEEGRELNNIGKVYDALRKKQEALDYYEQALVILREVGDRAGEGATLNNVGLVYDALGKKQEALDYYEQVLMIVREVEDRAGEGTILYNIGDIYAHFGQLEVALACILLAKALFEYVQSPSDIDREVQWIAALRTHLGEQQFAALFAQVEHRASEIVERALQEKVLSDGAAQPIISTLPAEQTTIVGNTIAVMTTISERRAEWREAIAQMLQAAQQQGADWQTEVEFFTAILAILDGRSPSLAANHPYASAIAAIQDGIARGGPQIGDGDDVSEEEQALEAFVQASVAALRSPDPQEKMAFMQQLITLQAQAPNDEMKALLQALQLALFGGDLVRLGEQLTGFARQIWDVIVAGVW